MARPSAPLTDKQFQICLAYADRSISSAQARELLELPSVNHVSTWVGLRLLQALREGRLIPAIRNADGTTTIGWYEDGAGTVHALPFVGSQTNGGNNARDPEEAGRPEGV